MYSVFYIERQQRKRAALRCSKERYGKDFWNFNKEETFKTTLLNFMCKSHQYDCILTAQFLKFFLVRNSIFYTVLYGKGCHSGVSLHAARTRAQCVCLYLSFSLSLHPHTVPETSGVSKICDTKMLLDVVSLQNNVLQQLHTFASICRAGWNISGGMSSWNNF